MSIDKRGQEQLPVADRMFMDFKYSTPGSQDQVHALKTLNVLIGMWADYFLHAEIQRMDFALTLKRAKPDQLLG